MSDRGPFRSRPTPRHARALAAYILLADASFPIWLYRASRAFIHPLQGLLDMFREDGAPAVAYLALKSFILLFAALTLLLPILAPALWIALLISSLADLAWMTRPSGFAPLHLLQLAPRFALPLWATLAALRLRPNLLLSSTTNVPATSTLSYATSTPLPAESKLLHRLALAAASVELFDVAFRLIPLAAQASLLPIPPTHLRDTAPDLAAPALLLTLALTLRHRIAPWVAPLLLLSAFIPLRSLPFTAFGPPEYLSLATSLALPTFAFLLWRNRAP